MISEIFSPNIAHAIFILFLVSFGVCGLGGLLLLAILYFRLTRKYDAIFSDHDRMVPMPSIMGTALRTSCYALCIIFRNFTKKKRNKRIYEVTGDYDFRANASKADILLSYLLFIFSMVTTVSVFIVFIMSKTLNIDY